METGRKKMSGRECLDLLVASKRSWSPEERHAYAHLLRLLRHGRVASVKQKARVA